MIYKCIFMGLDYDVFRALTGKYPPKIRMYSKYERRTDTRTYEDRKKLYEGVRSSLTLKESVKIILQGWEILYCELLEKDWKEKIEEFSKHARGL